MKEGLFELRGEVKVSRKSWAILLSASAGVVVKTGLEGGKAGSGVASSPWLWNGKSCPFHQGPQSRGDGGGQRVLAVRPEFCGGLIGAEAWVRVVFREQLRFVLLD